MENYKRCVCGAVSHPEILSDTARLSPKTFYKDPADSKHFICSDCYEAIIEQRHDYLLDDLNEKQDGTDNDSRKPGEVTTLSRYVPNLLEPKVDVLYDEWSYAYDGEEDVDGLK